jgi:hypothetical protein
MQCEWCGRALSFGAPNAYHPRCKWMNAACVMAFFAGLYEAAYVEHSAIDGPTWRDGFITGEAEGFATGQGYGP